MRVQLKPGWRHVYPRLWPLNTYCVIECNSWYYTIINDAGQPVPYNAKAFTIVDPHHPSDWVQRIDEEGDVAYIPEALQEPAHFWERFHDRDREAVRKFRAYIDKVLTEPDPSRPPPTGNRYVRVRQAPAEGAIEIVVELDCDGLEVRRVERFANGKYGCANVVFTCGTAGPTELQESGSDPRSPVRDGGEGLSEAEFEEIWRVGYDSAWLDEKALNAAAPAATK
ncbi:MAG: hypothetical protein IPQ07_13345 [Myxococcales bacterium]|nr:hypothetical protein [Myxococcales bacterium]